MSFRINRSVDRQSGSYFTAGSPPECPAQERRRDSANGQHLQVDIDLLGGLLASGENLRARPNQEDPNQDRCTSPRQVYFVGCTGLGEPLVTNSS